MAKLTGPTGTAGSIRTPGTPGTTGPTRTPGSIGTPGATGAPGTAPTPRPKPTPEQHLAADPECSVWVSASAGTGKTRVLSNRLLRLLLNGSDPANILCLTYTKAGAAEMARRVQDDLARFAVLPEETLKTELTGLIGRSPKTEETERARAGLARVLDLPAGLRIMTIHSFCQSLLRRFPLEAGVSPHFDLLEPRAAAGLFQQARDDVLISRNPALQAAVAKLAVALGEHSLTEGLSALNNKRAELTRKLACYEQIDDLIAEVYTTLDVEVGTKASDLRLLICSDPMLDEPALMAASSALMNGGKTDEASSQAIARWLQADQDRRQALLVDYQLVFLTKDGEPRKKLATKKVVEKAPNCQPALEAEQNRLLAAAERQKAVVVAERTAALLRVGAAIIEGYERRKQAEGKLDYTDLIDRCMNLLQQPDIGLWVRYKLDQQIDHLLIDESQDTSPDQWAIVEALIDDFFSGDSGRDRPPTLFVVGDEKQSIFGFQGANVDTYQRLRQTFAKRAHDAGLAWREAPLARSFRSAPAILEAVDAVFAKPDIRAGVLSGDEPMAHQAFHEQASGLVEVWPLIEPAVKPATEPWQLPDEALRIDQAEQRLARAVTEQIRRWLLDRVQLANHERPIEPGDVMILLPRRGILQDLLVRELKKQNVPVAGADRLSLTDELAVMDLMALGDALLLPEDDLTVATMLRSPLFGFGDDDLFALAHNRGDRPLYLRLRDLRDDRKIFAEADDHFSALLGKVDYTPPFEFFSTFLSQGSPNGRRRLLRRLGPAAALPIEAFLAQAIAYERNHPPSMQGFLHWLRADSDAIKRDANDAKNEVRVLTVHGSKGLEAPIVFLADATYMKDIGQDRLLWRDDGLPLWKVAQKAQDPVSRRVYERQLQRTREEHRRLLYVAMTRAEERLIVTGWRRKQAANTGSWYDLIAAGMERLPGAARTPMTLKGTEPGEGWRFTDRVSIDPVAAQAEMPFGLVERSGTPPMPPWLADAARGELRAEALSPSADPETDDPPAASPLSDEDQRRFGRGLLIHRLLQILPDVAAIARAAMMTRYLEKPGFGLDDAVRVEIAGQVLAILENPDWSAFFGPSSRAEVPLVGEIAGQMVSGQIDRLAVLPDHVTILDYKTNRPPPRQLDEVPPAYCRQMAIYRALLRKIYPGRDVHCALLWTEGPDLMVLTDRQLSPFERMIGDQLDNRRSAPTSA